MLNSLTLLLTVQYCLERMLPIHMVAGKVARLHVVIVTDSLGRTAYTVDSRLKIQPESGEVKT